ncbi:MAG: hypothetical protein HGB29_02600 [Chlorobiaceae bacterium]|nr:hypothetical protein [Chlorobiaceae bacterium]NTW73734.1 hypothetical protein [Chlorobiaceae bacterium]
MRDEQNHSGQRRYCREMTVADIRFPEEGEVVEVLFLESARFYRLQKGNADYVGMLARLKDAMTAGETVTLCFDAIDSDLIEEVC